MSDFPERLGISTAQRSGDEAEATFTVSGEHLNQNGTLHGGVIATLCDTTMGRAVQAVLDDDHDGAATVSMTVTYLSPANDGDELRASAEVRREGEKIIIVEANVVRPADGKPIAHAVATFASIG